MSGQRVGQSVPGQPKRRDSSTGCWTSWTRRMRRVRMETEVAKARKMMGVGKEQPSIMTKLRKGTKKVVSQEPGQ